jgi:hypothetical protein
MKDHWKKQKSKEGSELSHFNAPGIAVRDGRHPL